MVELLPEQLPVRLPVVAVGHEGEEPVPANQLVNHGETGPARVDRGTLVEQVGGCLDRVQDNDNLAGDISVDDIRVCEDVR